MLKEIIGYRNSIKKTRAETKVILNEIKKNPPGTNSGGDEAKIQINNLERKDEIRTQPKQQKEKRIF